VRDTALMPAVLLAAAAVALRLSGSTQPPLAALGGAGMAAPPQSLPPVSPPVNIFCSETYHGLPGSVLSFGNTLSLLLLASPPRAAAAGHDENNNATLLAATRANLKGADYPVLRRSTDGGVSFGSPVLPVGGPVDGVHWQQVMQAYDATNNRVIMLLGSGRLHANKTCQSGGLRQVVSTDRGQTFSPPEDISPGLSIQRDRSCISPPGGIGIQLRPDSTNPNGHGELLMAATQHAYQGDIILRQRAGASSGRYNVSDGLHLRGLDEMQLAQLGNGSVMAFARNCADATGSMKNCVMTMLSNSADQVGELVSTRARGAGGARVMVSVSNDSGVHWSAPRPHPDLVTPVCNFGVTHHRGAVLFSGPYSETSRTNLSVLASLDDGVHFTRSLVLVPGPAGYSNVQCGLPEPYDCAVLFSTQTTRKIQLVRFQSNSLLGGR
jgi:hypothetical protein